MALPCRSGPAFVTSFSGSSVDIGAVVGFLVLGLVVTAFHMKREKKTLKVRGLISQNDNFHSNDV